MLVYPFPKIKKGFNFVPPLNFRQDHFKFYSDLVVNFYMFIIKNPCNYQANQKPEKNINY